MADKKCPGSGTVQMLAWPPDGDGYPGAAICTECSHGVQVRQRGVHLAVSQTGHSGLAGTLLTHMALPLFRP